MDTHTHTHTHTPTHRQKQAGCCTHDDEEDEVDEVVEGVSVHHKVHDVHPALQSDHLERGGEKRTVVHGWWEIVIVIMENSTEFPQKITNRTIL